MPSTDVVAGVQLPPDSTGKIMADFPVEVPSPNGPQTVHVPASAIVDANGREIGSQLLKAVGMLTATLRELIDAGVAV
jgi:hypothetical protein